MNENPKLRTFMGMIDTIKDEQTLLISKETLKEVRAYIYSLEEQLKLEPKVDRLKEELEKRITMAQSKLLESEAHISELIDDDNAWHGYLSACRWFEYVLNHPEQYNLIPNKS